MADHIRYDLLTQQALRGVVRDVLADVAKKGLPGDHHFYIAFDTRAEGVRMSERLRAQYSEELTIILQHQFWDLAVNDEGFEVGLSFGGVPEKLAVPFTAINGFFDPSVQFGLQFEEIGEGQSAQGAAANADEKGSKRPTPLPAATAPPKETAIAPKEKARSPAPAKAEPKPSESKPAEPEPAEPEGGGQVVRLDRFRKK
jgi:uncharacterized protein